MGRFGRASSFVRTERRCSSAPWATTTWKAKRQKHLTKASRLLAPGLPLTSNGRLSLLTRFGIRASALFTKRAGLRGFGISFGTAGYTVRATWLATKEKAMLASGSWGKQA